MLLEAALRDLQHRDPRVRAQAADALGRADAANHATALTALGEAVDDAHPSVRYAALLSFGELGAGAAVDALVAHLERRRAAVPRGGGDRARPARRRRRRPCLGSAAGRARRPRARGALSGDRPRSLKSTPRAPRRWWSPLLDDDDAKVRAQAAAALGDAGEQRFADRLARLLDDASDVRHEAALALARLGDRRALLLLTAALAVPDRALDAATALAALGIGDDAAVGAALAHELGRFFGDAARQGACGRGARPRR